MSLPIGSVPTSAIQDTSNVIFADGDAPRKYAYGEVKKDLLGTESLNTTAQTIKGAINENVASLSDITINAKNSSFGIVGDGIADDTIAFQNLMNYAATNNCDVLVKNLTIKTTDTITVSNFNRKLQFKFSQLIMYNDTVDKNVLVFNQCDDIELKGVRPRTSNSDSLSLGAKGHGGIVINDSKRPHVKNCEVTYVTDGIAFNNCTRPFAKENTLHELGEEPICIRECINATIKENELYNHHGDGILIKHRYTTSKALHYISNNYIHDGLKQADGVYSGGGITSNCEYETSQTAIGTAIGLIIKDNIIEKTSYGISLANISQVQIKGNKIFDVTERDAIGIDTGSVNNGAGHSFIDISIESNLINNTNHGIYVYGTDSGISIDDVRVINNTIKNTIKEGIYVKNATVTGNILKTIGSYGIRSSSISTVSNNTIKICTRTALMIDYGSLVENNYIDGCYDIALVGDNVLATNNFFTNCFKFIQASNSIFSNNKFKTSTFTHPADTTLINNFNTITLLGSINFHHNNIDDSNGGIIYVPEDGNVSVASIFGQIDSNLVKISNNNANNVWLSFGGKLLANVNIYDNVLVANNNINNPSATNGHVVVR